MGERCPLGMVLELVYDMLMLAFCYPSDEHTSLLKRGAERTLRG